MENKELEKCTFKPDLKNSSTSLTRMLKKPKVLLKRPTKEKIKIERTQPDVDARSVTKHSEMSAGKGQER